MTYADEEIESNIIIEKYLSNTNILHSESGPARFEYSSDGSTLLKESYYREGKLHREDGPAVISYHQNGFLDLEFYYLNGEVKRLTEGPEIISYYSSKSNQIWAEMYASEDMILKRSALDLPAITHFYESGDIKRKDFMSFKEKPVLHRENGPARIYYNRDGSISQILYFENDKKHNYLGPANVRYDKDQNIIHKVYLIHGKLKTRKEWFESLPVQNKPLALLNPDNL
jgi:hypothetical protein